VWEGWTLEMARNDSQKFFQLVETAQGLLIFTDSTSSKNSVLGCMHPCRRALSRKIADWCAVKKSSHCQDKRCKESNDNIGSRESTLSINSVTFFLLIIVHITDYHWDRHLYFVIHSHHAQTMTHTPPSDDSILILRLVVLVACDSD
jgi:hypothetical protein